MDEGDGGQDRFLRRIRKALSRPDPGAVPSPERPSAAGRETAGTDGGETHPPDGNRVLLGRLTQAAPEVDLRVSIHPDLPSAAGYVADRIQEAAADRGAGLQVGLWRHPLLESLDLPRRMAGSGVSLRTVAAGRDRDAGTRRWMARCRVGLTTADWVLADTATLVCRSRPGRPRALLLLPEVHIALAPADRLIADLAALYRLAAAVQGGPQRWLGHCTTLITGPSRTRDIEGVMVFGAHGPREVHLVVVGEG